jgi:excisionase family DNA binding protein
VSGEDGELLTIEQLAERLGLKANTLYAWRHQGKMPDPDQRYGRLMLWRWATIERCDVPVIQRRVIGRPQA